MDEEPDEFTNLWDDGAHQAVKLWLMKASFDATVLGGDIGPPIKPPGENRRTGSRVRPPGQP